MGCGMLPPSASTTSGASTVRLFEACCSIAAAADTLEGTMSVWGGGGIQ
jgi:hypothetical protein